MNNDSDFETYIYLGENKFVISSFSKINNQLSFKDEYYFDDLQNKIKYNDQLHVFLNNNIFKLEKKNNEFIKDITLIVNNECLLSIYLGLKKNLFTNQVTEKDKINILADMKNYLKKNYQEHFIIHLIITNHYFNELLTEDYNKDNVSYDFSLEANFIIISKEKFSFYEQIFKNYHITINSIISGTYAQNYFKDKQIDECQMGFKIKGGCNPNEILLVKKDKLNIGFFEKFFNFFS